MVMDIVQHGAGVCVAQHHITTFPTSSRAKKQVPSTDPHQEKPLDPSTWELEAELPDPTAKLKLEWIESKWHQCPSLVVYMDPPSVSNILRCHLITLKLL